MVHVTYNINAESGAMHGSYPLFMQMVVIDESRPFGDIEVKGCLTC